MKFLEKPIHHALLTAKECGYKINEPNLAALAKYICDFVTPNVEIMQEVAVLQGKIDYMQEAIKTVLHEPNKEAANEGAEKGD